MAAVRQRALPARRPAALRRHLLHLQRLPASPAMRLAALMEQPVILVFTHDSIGLGEDGPTHQPVEHLPALRAIPHLVDIRPADANETIEAWKVALRRREGAGRAAAHAPEAAGARPRAVRAGRRPGARRLRARRLRGRPRDHPHRQRQRGTARRRGARAPGGEGVRSRVVNLASWQLFEDQDQAYRDEVLPPSCRRRLAVEAAATLRLGALGRPRRRRRRPRPLRRVRPVHEVLTALGFTADNVYTRAKALLAKGVDR